MISLLKCSQGHSWEPSASSSAPLVCPDCGRPPLASGAGAMDDPERTIDHAHDAPQPLNEQDAERTIDLPTPAPMNRPLNVPEARPGQMLPSSSTPHNDATEAMNFTPLPRPPAHVHERTSSPRPAPTPAAATAGASMPFTILRQHARGGLGLVNLARDEQIKREVALKQILPQHVDNMTLRKRFLYEAQITGQLEHPSIVPVYTLGTDAEGAPYYVMRFVKGRTLDAIITEHHFSPNPIVFRELLRRFVDVCQAVAYAHSRGVIHRDLKPSNIMLGDYGETLVLDWGLAKDIKNKTDPSQFGEDHSSSASRISTPSQSSAGGQSSVGGGRLSASQAPMSEMTMEGQIIGTPAYMAPEQAEGKTELHGPVTDIYALGGILYKILAGQSPTAPTASTTATTGQRVLTFVASVPPSKVNKDVHPALERICVRAMATDPAARYPRALEIVQDIQHWLDANPLILKKQTTTTKMVAFLRRYAVPITIGLLIIILLLTLMLTLPAGPDVHH